MTEISVQIPVDIRDVPSMDLVRRPNSLKGLRVGLLDNGKEFTDIVYEGLAEVLKRDYGVAEAKVWPKVFPAKAAPFIADMVSANDVAISGIGH